MLKADCYCHADDGNLPKIDLEMVLHYFQTKGDGNIPELSGKKAGHSMRSEYTNSAIGWVEVMRENQTCHVRCKISPEYNLNHKYYTITCTINEIKNNEEILTVKCDGCAASEGHCKHTTAFMGWLLQRSTSPASTERECYWKKPTLSKINSKRITTSKDFGAKDRPQIIDKSRKILQLFTAQKELPKNIVFLQAMGYTEGPYDSIMIHKRLLQFKRYTDDGDVNSFLSIFGLIDHQIYFAACEDSVDQSKSYLWHNLRYGRITASILHEAAHAKNNESLKVKIIGKSKLNISNAMKRGKELEDDIFRAVKKKLKINFQKTGFLVSAKWPNFGASPDGISDEYVLEIKAPSKQKTISNYFDNGHLMPKVKSQIQLQMFIFKKVKGYLAIASPTFENDGCVTCIEENFDNDYIINLINSAHQYWCDNIFNFILMQ